MNPQKTFNTDHLMTYPDAYLQPPEETTVKKNNNARYKFFKQNHFTAGDEDQFLEFWDRSTPLVAPSFKSQINLNKDIQVDSNVGWSKYRRLCVDDVIATYHYLANKFKKGIFMKITDGEPKVFLPFSKVDYQNEWSDKIKTNPRRFPTILQLMQYTAGVEKREFVEGKVHKNVKAWYGNNGLVRLEFPISEGDSGVNMLHDMFATLARERKLPSCELFLNKRDFPLLKKDDTEAYDSFFGTRTRLLSHSYPRYAPILGMTTTDAHADIPIPTWEDWSRIAYWSEGKMFGKEFRKFTRPEEFDAISWEEKIPTAIFRGASTGQGTMIDNNVRLAMAAESQKGLRDEEDEVLFLDAGITKWNLRPRKHPCFPYIETVHVEEMPFGLVAPLSPLEQARHKYILHLPGHSEAYRLGMEMYSGSVILYHPCQYRLWFFQWMKPWVHYIPLTGGIEDVYEKIRWCKANDEKCRVIAMNAREFAHKYLGRDAVLDYLQKTLWELYSATGKIEHTPLSMSQMNMSLYQQVQGRRESFLNRYLTIVSQEDHEALLPFFSTLSRSMKAILLRIFYRRLLVEETPYKESKNTSIFRSTFAGQTVAIKKTKKTWKCEDRFQLLCSYLYINDLADMMPHYLYTYADYGQLSFSIVSDFIDGPTMEEHLQLPGSDLASLVDMCLYLCLALHAGQQHCGFLHMDLYPWNVLIQKHAEPVLHSYAGRDGTVCLRNTILPIMVDYGKSHFVHQGSHHYNTSPFSMCRLQDVISIVFSSLYVLLEKQKLSDRDLRFTLLMMNFFSGSEYTKQTHFNNINHVKSFLKKHKKFSKMLAEPKLGLENKSPLDFFYFLVDMKFPRNVMVEFQERSFSYPRLAYPMMLEPESGYEDLQITTLQMERLRSIGQVRTWGVLDFRKQWLSLERLWTILVSQEQEMRSLYTFHVLSFFADLIHDIRVMEKKTGKKVWDQVTIEDLMRDFPSSEIPDTMPAILPTTTSKMLPYYPTHACAVCLRKLLGDGQRIDPVAMCLLHRRWLGLQRLSILHGHSISADLFSIYTGICEKITLSRFLESPTATATVPTRMTTI
jgi:hypothetical protein